METKSKLQLLMDLFRSIWLFITGWKGNQENARREKFKEAEKNLEKQYNRVDENKNKNKSKDTEDRLNSMF